MDLVGSAGINVKTDPKVFTKIHINFIVTGKDLDPKRVEKAVTLSEEKYCSASIMLGKTAMDELQKALGATRIEIVPQKISTPPDR